MLSRRTKWDCGFPAGFMLLQSQRPLWGCPHGVPQDLLFVGFLDQDGQQQLFQLDSEAPWVGTRGYFTCREGAASRRALVAVQGNKGYVHVCV